MRTKPHLVATLVLLIGATTLAGCGDRSFFNAVPANATVAMEDQCEPASFNAALGVGSCSRQGDVTLTEFSTELTATQSVASWRFVPAELTIRIGQAINAINAGGEVHTFTKVAVFGGGVVPVLNTASRSAAMAPECANLTPAKQVMPGATFTTDVASAVGTERYQCCIHPWMRSTVIVRN